MMVNQEQINTLKMAIENRLNLGEKQIGWKLGFGSPGGLRALGISRPLVGALFDKGEIIDGNEIDISSMADPRVEAEIAAHIDKDIPNDATFNQIKASVSSLVPAIELVDFHSPPSNPVNVLSDNIYQRGWVISPCCDSRWQEGANGLSISVSMADEIWEPFNDIESQIGLLSDNLDECNKIASSLGRGILGGDIILLGSVIPPHPINGKEFVVDMAGRGRISLKFK